MKKQQLKSLELKKQSISTLLTGGKAAIPTTLKTNLTCGVGLTCKPTNCTESIIACNTDTCTLAC